MSDPEPGGARVDRWLWSVRIFKTRSRATAACRAGHVAVAGVTVKAARELQPGDVVVVQVGLVQRTLLVRGHPENRVGAKRVPEYCEDRTPPEEFEKARQNPIGQFLARARGTGRPTKRDRRSLEGLINPDEG